MTVTVRVDLHRPAIHHFLYSSAGPVVRGVRDWTQDVRSRAVRRVPKVTGRLAASSSVVMRTFPGLVVGTVEFSAPNSVWVERGTGIYGPLRRPIRSTSGGMLRFRTGSGRLAGSQRGLPRVRPYTYVFEVKGQHPKPYLVPSLVWVMAPKGARIIIYRK